MPSQLPIKSSRSRSRPVPRATLRAHPRISAALFNYSRHLSSMQFVCTHSINQHYVSVPSDQYLYLYTFVYFFSFFFFLSIFSFFFSFFLPHYSLFFFF